MPLIGWPRHPPVVYIIFNHFSAHPIILSIDNIAEVVAQVQENLVNPYYLEISPTIKTPLSSQISYITNNVLTHECSNTFCSFISVLLTLRSFQMFTGPLFKKKHLLSYSTNCWTNGSDIWDDEVLMWHHCSIHITTETWSRIYSISSLLGISTF